MASLLTLHPRARGAAGLLLVLLAACGGGSRSGGGGAAPLVPTPEEAGAAEIAAIQARHDVNTAVGAYAAAKALLARAEDFRGSAEAVRTANVIRKAGLQLRDTVLVLDQDFALMREERNEARYGGELAQFLNAEWLLETDRIEARRLHERLQRAGAKNHGYVPKADLEPLPALLARLQPKAAARTDLESTPFFTAATQIAEEIKADLEKRFADLPAGQYRGASVTIEKPYVFLIQADPSWDPVLVAKNRAQELKALEDIIFQEYGAALGLKPIEEPVPVLFFRNYDMYKKYAGLDPNTTTFAHFEPLTGRLAVHDRCDHTTIMHEGTHQLMWAWTEKKSRAASNILTRSYWFQEGIAEWYGGAARLPKPDGGYDYEIGLLHEARLNNIRQYQTQEGRKRLFTLRELLTRTYAHRPSIEANGRTGALYAQGWFFIYFMNHFDADGNGLVRVGKPGKYRDRWRRYVEAELQGRTGLKVFHEVMGTDDAALAAMEEEYWRYYEFIQYKRTQNQVKNGRIIPWNEWRNRRGELAGEEKDDMLPPFDPETTPPRKTPKEEEAEAEPPKDPEGR
jgi:hypothetical protein